MTAGQVLDAAVAARAFPGAVAESGTREAAVWQHATGTLTYEAGAPAVDAGTRYDLASLTKVIATTSLAMRLVRDGALGWDTMLPTSSCGSRMSSGAIGHTGFTGTSLWIDPVRDRYYVLLANRVHPSRENNAIRQVRRDFHDAFGA
jgi:CubicO group peptidase (beta-lactamase class C family)